MVSPGERFRKKTDFLNGMSTMIDVVVRGDDGGRLLRMPCRNKQLAGLEFESAKDTLGRTPCEAVEQNPVVAPGDHQRRSTVRVGRAG